MFPASRPRAEQLRTKAPQLMADLYLYSSSEGGRQSPVSLGWGCPCCRTKEPPFEGWDAWPLLLDGPLSPGGRARVGFVFLSGEEAVAALKSAEVFYLVESGVIGEARIVA